LESAAEADQILLSRDTYVLVKVEHCRPEVGSTESQGTGLPGADLRGCGFGRQERENKLGTCLEGFNLPIDFNKLSDADRRMTKEMMEKLLPGWRPGRIETAPVG
jgi:hypothetical protein